MPESYGKRQRRDSKAKKAAAIEERRRARAQRKEDRAAGLIESGPPLGDPFDPTKLDDVDAPPAPYEDATDSA